MLVLSKLKWDLSVVTAHDFLEQIMCRIPAFSTESSKTIKRHAQTFIALAATGENFFIVLEKMLTGP